ncbi:phospholipase DDHD1-like isoform X2 [Zootermopsis nevadensis]|uniref:phospholipase DDHD1-like isoform X2 n=1 Tax=Zootermopsis nevadensis TaxID=136037 RepID=UPI000B8E4E08|nr:phospholipase DDHD1-like isoform X2 [Zootermopsis nevadensis]
MNLNSSDKGSIQSAYQLNEEFGKVSLERDSAFEYSEGDDVLYVTQQEILSENFCYNVKNVPLLDSGEGSSGDAQPATWGCLASDSELVDCVVGELGPDEVRWFYKSDSDKRWIEFSGYDSLRIESKYRNVYHDWQYYNKYSNKENSSETCFDETSPIGQSALPLDISNSASYSSECNGTGATQTLDSEQYRIVVRGGMYEVDLNTCKCDSIYWPGEECAITRGIWFYDGSWIPVDTECSNILENVHLELFFGKKLSDYITEPCNKTPKAVLHTESFTEFHVDWYSPTEVYQYSEAAPSKLVRTFTQRLGFQKSTGYRLCRGYKVHATDYDRPVDITHLVFVIHGIGQKMDTGRIIRNTSAFRDCVTWLKQKYFASSENRVEFFPVEWRSSLKLDGDTVEAITPHKLLGLRQLLNSSAMDIMYYTSPLYGCEVQRGLLEELNRLYTMFTQRNPYFTSSGGKVSVIAHSLGCVIVYDIVTGWRSDLWQVGTLPHPHCSADDSSLPETPRQEFLSPENPRLRFEIDNLFCLGSPLSVFLALRMRDPQAPGQVETILPPSLCKKFYNVFHPTDPVAYRMEPLLLRDYSKIAPLQIQAYNATVRIDYKDMPLEPIVPEITSSNDCSSSVSKHREGLEEMEADSPSNTPSKAWNIWGLMRWNKKPQDEAEGRGSPQFDALPAGHHQRLDYVLRETNLAGSYFSALTSHTAYWNNYDVAYFVLTRLFPDLEAQQLLQQPSASISQQSPASTEASSANK